MNIREMPIEAIASLAQRLVAAQFPQWADLPLASVENQGNDNRTFRLGAEMSVRLPSAERYVPAVVKEQTWLPRLAPNLPLAIPAPVALGEPGEGYPWRWSIYRWLEGESAAVARVSDLVQLARALAQFLSALQAVDAIDGPPAGPESFFRGDSLRVYDDQTRRAIDLLRGQIDADAATEVWEAALTSTWTSPPVWFHGDIVSMNLLVERGELSAVVDFGTFGVGDPACDLAIAWTFLDRASRDVFKSMLPLDRGTWARGRGWALWKALIVLAQADGRTIWTKNPTTGQNTIDEVIEDHRMERSQHGRFRTQLGDHAASADVVRSRISLLRDERKILCMQARKGSA